jgi:signal transduction histidine kinase
LAIFLSLLAFAGIDRLANPTSAAQPLAAESVRMIEGEASSAADALSIETVSLPMIAPGEFPLEAGHRWLKILTPFHHPGSLLHISRGDLLSVRLYTVSAGQATLIASLRAETSPLDREIVSRKPVFPLPALSEGDFWLLEYQTRQPGFAQFNLWPDRAAFSSYQLRHDTLVAAYLGVLCLLFVVNAFIYLTSRQRTYGFYAAFLGFHGLSTFGYEGGYVGWHLAAWPYLHQLLMLSIPLSLYYVLRFSADYLRLREDMPIWHQATHRLSQACLLLLLQSLALPFPPVWSGFIVLQSIVVLLGAWFLIVLGMAAARERRDGSTLLFLFAFIPHGLAVSSFLLQRFEILTPDPNFYYKLLAASSFEMTLLALGLTLVIRHAREARDAAQAAEIRLLQNARSQEAAFREGLEREVTQRTAELSRANQSKDQLLSVLAHDLRSPLNSIVRIAESTLPPRREPSPDELRRIVGEIHRTGKSLYGLLENLLRWSQGNWEGVKSDETPCDLGLAISRESQLYRSAMEEKEIQWILDPAPEEWPFVAFDPDELAVVVRNLLSNAVRHTNRSGEIRATFTTDHSFCLWRLENSGEPVKETFPSSLPEGIITTENAEKSPPPSAGLGLRLCHDFLTRHGGEIRLFAREEKWGSCAEVRFRLAD